MYRIPNVPIVWMPVGFPPRKEGQSLEKYNLAKYRHALFAEKPSKGLESEGWMNVHLLMWKRVISLLVQVDTEDKTFHPKEVWRSVFKWRFEAKAKSLNEKVQSAQRRADTQGTKPPNKERRSC